MDQFQLIVYPGMTGHLFSSPATAVLFARKKFGSYQIHLCSVVAEQERIEGVSGIKP